MNAIQVMKVDQDALVRGVKWFTNAFDQEDGVDVSEVSATFLDALIADLKEVWDGGCDHSVGICKCDLADILQTLTAAREGLAPCRICQTEGVVWNPTDEDDQRETTCPRCGGRGWIGRGEEA